MYSVGIAYLLWLISGFGALGFHRFYLGKFFTGLLWMFTGGLGMIGSIYDFITLPVQVMEANRRRSFYDNANANINANVNNNNNYTQPTWRNVDDGEAHIINDKD
jgi:TM2 domain-containing membrane protein YozV